jgi:hypothetical protein
VLVSREDLSFIRKLKFTKKSLPRKKKRKGKKRSARNREELDMKRLLLFVLRSSSALFFTKFYNNDVVR